MITFREIKRSINQFYILVTEYPDDVKKDLEEFSLNARILHEIISVYLQELKDIRLEILEDYDFFENHSKNSSVLKRIICFFTLKRILVEKSKCEKLIDSCEDLKKKMDYVLTRVRQFQFFS